MSAWVKESNERFCIIEIKKEGCGACSYNGKIFDLLSVKFREQGVLVPFYRMNIDNQSPYTGKFFYSPLYLFLRKERGEITELLTLPTPSTTDNNLTEFLTKI